MNERIRELAKQADGVFIHKLITGAKQCTFLEKDLEKFAELIVSECVEAARTVGGSAGVEVETIIRNHFGVEERKGWICPKCGTDRTKAVCPKGHSAAMTGACPMIGEAQ